MVTTGRRAHSLSPFSCPNSQPVATDNTLHFPFIPRPRLRLESLTLVLPSGGMSWACVPQQNPASSACMFTLERLITIQITFKLCSSGFPGFVKTPMPISF